VKSYRGITHLKTSIFEREIPHFVVKQLIT